MLFRIEHDYYGEVSVEQDDVIMRHKEERYDHVSVLYSAMVVAGDMIYNL